MRKKYEGSEENREERRRGKSKEGKVWNGRGEAEGEEKGSGKKRERDGNGGVERKGGWALPQIFSFSLPSTDLEFRLNTGCS